jgi:ribosomal protein S18 acetylase RimI-like enzyme
MVTDSLPARDALAVKQMIHDYRALLGTDGHGIDGVLECSIVAVLRCNGETVGAIVCNRVKHVAHMHLLVVHQEHRRKGYADALPTHFMVESFYQGALGLSLFAQATSYTARSLYENHFGFCFLNQDDSGIHMLLPKY